MIENYSIDFFVPYLTFDKWDCKFPINQFLELFFSYQLQAIFAKRRFSLKKSDSCKISLETTTRWQKSG